MKRLGIGLFVVVVVLAVVGAVGAGLYSHTYGVDVAAADGTLPTLLRTCGRDFHPAGAPVTAQQAAADAPGASEIGTWAPPLRTAMPILGRSDLAACGMLVYLQRAPDDLVPYGLVGGP